MANININNLAGSDLFNDSESFLTEMSDEINEIIGGAREDSKVVTLSSVQAGLRTWQCIGKSDLWMGPPVIVIDMSA